MEHPESKIRIIRATLDLLSQSGLSGVAINQVVAASAAPKGSIYHFFPGGKLELATVALKQAEQSEGQWLRGIFQQHESIAQKVELLFTSAANLLEESGFMKGCPVAAVALDLDRDSEGLRPVCRAIFTMRQNIIAAGLDEVPEPERLQVAELILAVLEGALILARTEAAKDPLLRTGRILGEIFGRKFRAVSPDVSARPT
jgi:TetR/AcrR family transcriptional repressor of lmrAB and yxaGH operons